MDVNFFIYLEQLELMIFFSGYPLIYLLVGSLANMAWSKRIFKKDITTILPYAYALVGILYLGLQLKNLSPDFSFEHIRTSTEIPALKIWGLMSIFFLIPFLSKKPILSLLHSLVFFFFLVRDLWLNFFQATDGTALKNDMNLYSYSLLINIAALGFVLLMNTLFTSIKNRGNK